MTTKLANPRLAVALLVITGIAAAAYTYNYRYFLRIVPLPVSAIGMLFGPDGPASEFRPRTHVQFPDYDLTDPKGLRRALDHIRAMSPLQSPAGPVTYGGIDAEGWLRQLPVHAMYCTDATQLFMLMAHQQGLRVREWWLWASAGYADGNAHSLAGFYNPRIARWQIVDPFTASVFERPDGSPATMEDVLRGKAIRFDRSQSVEASNVAGYDIARILDDLTSQSFTPVLNLKPPSWFAETPKSDLVIAYAVLLGNSYHSLHIYLTKLALLIAVVSLAGSFSLWVAGRTTSAAPLGKVAG